MHFIVILCDKPAQSGKMILGLEEVWCTFLLTHLYSALAVPYIAKRIINSISCKLEHLKSPFSSFTNLSTSFASFLFCLQKSEVPLDYNQHDPEQRQIYRFVRTLFSAAQLTAECAIVTLVKFPFDQTNTACFLIENIMFYNVAQKRGKGSLAVSGM